MSIFTKSKLKKTVVTLAALASTLAFTSNASANTDSSPWYLVAELGVANSQVSDVDLTRLLNQQNNPSTLSVNALRVDDSDTAWSLHAGYRFHQNLSVEFGYMDLGERSVDISGRTTDLNSFFQQVSAIHPEAGEGLSAAFAANFPVLIDNLSVTARLGYFDWDGGFCTNSGQQGVGRNEVEGEDVWYGLSLDYQFNQEISALISYKRVNLERDDNNVLSVGVVYHF